MSNEVATVSILDTSQVAVDELTTYLKAQLAKLNAEYHERIERYNAYLSEPYHPSEHLDRYERRHDRYREMLSEVHREWSRARDPYLKQITSILMAQAALEPFKPPIIVRSADGHHRAQQRQLASGEDVRRRGR